jgi:hypothetical protein
MPKGRGTVRRNGAKNVFMQMGSLRESWRECKWQQLYSAHKFGDDQINEI